MPVVMIVLHTFYLTDCSICYYILTIQYVPCLSFTLKIIINDHQFIIWVFHFFHSYFL